MYNKTCNWYVYIYIYIFTMYGIYIITIGKPSNVSTASMNPCVGHWQYLVSFSQADESKFFIRESFGKMLKAKFNVGTCVVKVDYWACFREEHQNGGFYYHCTLKLTNAQSGCQSKIKFQKNMVFALILATNIISFCLHSDMSVKGTNM